MLRNKILPSTRKNVFLFICPYLECNKAQTFQEGRKKILSKGKEKPRADY